MNNRTAEFFNFTDKPFTGYWDGKPYTFKAGQRRFLPEYLASHFAKHLANQVLLESGDPKAENYTSPKKPKEVPAFMNLFNKAFQIVDGDDDTDETQQEVDLVNREHERRAPKTVVDNKPPQVIIPADANAEDEDESDEDTFEGNKQPENKPSQPQEL